MPGKRVTPLRVRFEAKVDRSGGGTACWPWTASVMGAGYGQIGMGPGCKVNGLAHRVAYELHSGSPIPHELEVLHRCDNKLCCNPAHLFLGTQAENMADMDRKGRRRPAHNYGEASGMAKISADDVAEIRRLYAAGARQVDLADRFRVGQSTISSIVRRQTWFHV